MKILFYFMLLVVVQGQDDCIIDMSALDNEPIILYESSYYYIYPPSSNGEEIRTIPLPVNTTIIMICPGGNITTSDGVQPSMVYATCGENSQMTYNNGDPLEFNSVSCSSFRFEIVTSTQVSCGPDSELIIVGFQVELTFSFLPFFSVCFDTVKRNPIWTNYHHSASCFVAENAAGQNLFSPEIYNLDLNFTQLYDVDYQRSLINSLVGLPEDSTKYISNRPLWVEPVVQAQGIMTRYQSFATAYYFNTVPQWHILNGYYNWDRGEDSVWTYAQRNKVDFDVYTGTYGVATLPHEETDEDIELYLYIDGDTKVIPVPDIFWKVVFDPLTRRATALVTINHPYQRNVESKILCADISDQLDWLLWFRKGDLLYGYSYACTYQDLKAAIPYVPDLDVIDILV